jgi:hypothetical protein
MNTPKWKLSDSQKKLIWNIREFFRDDENYEKEFRFSLGKIQYGIGTPRQYSVGENWVYRTGNQIEELLGKILKGGFYEEEEKGILNGIRGLWMQEVGES